METKHHYVAVWRFQILTSDFDNNKTNYKVNALKEAGH